MDNIRQELINAAYYRAFALTDFNIHTDVDKQYEFRRQTIVADESLTIYEKLEAIKRLNMNYDSDRVLLNEGVKRICERCKQQCLAISYCEYCIRNHLKAKFSNWTSGNNEIDNLIRECQMEVLDPFCIEWIPYNNLKNIEYLTKGGCSEIYTADWIGGGYDGWDFKEQKLKRHGTEKVILKRLENVESANRSWFEEVCKLKMIIRS